MKFIWLNGRNPKDSIFTVEFYIGAAAAAEESSLVTRVFLFLFVLKSL